MRSIKEFFYRIKEKARRPGSNPEKVWFFFLESIAVLLIISGGLHWFIFTDVSNTESETNLATTTVALGTIDRDALEKVLSRFNEKETNRASLEEEVRAIGDPSI